MPVAPATLSRRILTPPKSSTLLLAPVQILDADGSYTSDCGLLIENARIADRGTASEVRGRHPNLPATDASEFVVFPGLINAHTHAAMGFFRDLGHSIQPPGQNESMIETFLFPAERALTPELLEPLAYSYLLSGLRSGVTTFVDHYYFIEGIGKALERLGLRGVIGETVADVGGAFPGEATWQRARTLLERWPFSDRILPAIAPHATDTVSEKLQKELARYAKQHHLPVHMHLSQTAGERQRVERAYDGISPVALAARSGLLSDRTLAVHLISADPADIKLLRQHGATAGFCPTSQILYERLAPIDQLLAEEVPIALGTDCAASNDSADMLTEMKFAALCARDRGHRLPAAQILSWATTQPGATLFGAATAQPLSIGAPADLVFMQPDICNLPLQDGAANLIFSTSSQHIRHVMIDGKWVLWQQEPVLFSETDMRAAYLQAVQDIQQRVKGLS